MDLNHLRTFHLVARHGTLTAAARAMGVPTSTLSRQLSRLEADLGVDLLRRTPRGVELTEAGTELFERSTGPLADLDDLAAALPSGRAHGVLRVTVPSNLARLAWFADLLLDFRHTHPAVGLDVELSNRPLVVEDGFDIAFRPSGLVPDSADLIARDLPTMEVRLYASPDYLARRGRPRRVHDLAAHDFVAARHLVGQPLVLRQGSRTRTVTPEPVMVGDDLSFVLPMVAAGAGFAPVPRPYVTDRTADFEEILPRWALPPLRPAIVWPRRRFTVPRIRAFVDFAVRRFAAQRGEG
ncbi:MAG: LysR family transcriptional regulator [Myxococcota bacterium]